MERGIALLDTTRDARAATEESRWDFFAIKWLSPDTFVRKETREGRACYLFQKKVKPASGHVAGLSEEANDVAFLENMPGQAWVDVTNKQLVAYNDGADSYVFTYGPPPTDLILPAAYSKMIRQYRENMNPLHIPIAPH